MRFTRAEVTSGMLEDCARSSACPRAIDALRSNLKIIMPNFEHKMFAEKAVGQAFEMTC